MVSTLGSPSFKFSNSFQALFSFLPHIYDDQTVFFFVRECGYLSRTSSHCHPLMYLNDSQSGPSTVRGGCPGTSGDMSLTKLFRPVPFNHLMISSLDYGFFIFNRSLKIKLDLEDQNKIQGGHRLDFLKRVLVNQLIP